MTWTYSGNPANSARDAIRFLIGDTNSGDQLLLDAEIAWLNEQVTGSATATTGLYDVAERACLMIASKLAREADKAIGDLKVSMSQRASAYREQAREMRVLAARSGSVPVPYAGGISISDKDIDDENSDLARGWFASGQFENVRDGGRTTDDRGVAYFGSGAD